MIIEITAIACDEKEILLNLMEKYEYELSQYFVHYVNELGLYSFDSLERVYYLRKSDEKRGRNILVFRHAR